jgi:hypothetical protein
VALTELAARRTTGRVVLLARPGTD